MTCICSECGITVDCGDTICPVCEINDQKGTTVRIEGVVDDTSNMDGG